MTTFKERPVSRSSLSDDEENKDKKKYQYSFIFKRYNPSEGSKYLIHEKGIFVLLFFLNDKDILLGNKPQLEVIQ